MPLCYSNIRSVKKLFICFHLAYIFVLTPYCKVICCENIIQCTNYVVTEDHYYKEWHLSNTTFISSTRESGY